MKPTINTRIITYVEDDSETRIQERTKGGIWAGWAFGLLLVLSIAAAVMFCYLMDFPAWTIKAVVALLVAIFAIAIRIREAIHYIVFLTQSVITFFTFEKRRRCFDKQSAVTVRDIAWIKTKELFETPL